MENKTTRLLLLFSVLSVAWSAQPTESQNGVTEFPTKSSKILMLLPFSPQSHRNCFIPFAQTLADRGHEITILSGLPPKFDKNPRITEIDHGIVLIDNNLNVFESRKQPQGELKMFETLLPKLAREMYDVPGVKELYKNKGQFDLMIIDELFNEFAFPFLHGSTFAFLAPPGPILFSSSAMGNPLNPAYFPTLLAKELPPFSMLHRWRNLFEYFMFTAYWKYWTIVPSIQQELNKKFPDLPPIDEIGRNVSLVLLNSHFSVSVVAPLLPSQVEVGGMHCRPGKPLPKDLNEFMESSGSDGVIYFSLGSIAKGTTLPENFRDIMLQVFGQMKQKVIFKFEGELKNLPTNVMIAKWLPQQDILAHPKVRVFITHGGLLGVQEAFYHGVPLLAMPIFGDQPKIAKGIESSNFGRMLTWEDLTPESFKRTLEDVISNPLYKKTVTTVSRAFRDQPMSPVEKAVWWTEYIIRHKGGPELISKARDLSWREFLFLDLILFIHVMVIFIVFSITRFCSFVCGKKNSKGVKPKSPYKKNKKV